MQSQKASSSAAPSTYHPTRIYGKIGVMETVKLSMPHSPPFSDEPRKIRKYPSSPPVVKEANKAMKMRNQNATTTKEDRTEQMKIGADKRMGNRNGCINRQGCVTKKNIDLHLHAVPHEFFTVQ